MVPTSPSGIYSSYILFSIFYLEKKSSFNSDLTFFSFYFTHKLFLPHELESDSKAMLEWAVELQTWNLRNTGENFELQETWDFPLHCLRIAGMDTKSYIKRNLTFNKCGDLQKNNITIAKLVHI